MKPRDLLVGLYLVGHPGAKLQSMADELGISLSQAHLGVKALERSRLMVNNKIRRKSLLEFIIHGVQYVFPASPGEETLGLPTGIAEPLFPADVATQRPMVWASPTGSVRGPSVEPLWKSVPFAVQNDRMLYEMLAAIDALRVGRARDRSVAVDYLTKELGDE